MKIKLLLVVAYEDFVFCKNEESLRSFFSHYCRSSEKDEDGEERNKKVSDDDDDDENGYEDVTEVKEEDVEKDRNADDE